MAYDRQIKALLIKRMKASLGLRSATKTNREGELREWFIHKLEGVVAYGMAPQDDLLGREIVRLHFVEGRPMNMVSAALGIPLSTAYRRMDDIFNAAADAIPWQMATSLLNNKVPRYRLKGCPQCGGDQAWDSEGAISLTEGEWVCLACGRRYNVEELSSYA